MQKMTLSILTSPLLSSGQTIPWERTPWGRRDWMQPNVPAHSISNCPIHTFFRSPSSEELTSHAFCVDARALERAHFAPLGPAPAPEANKRFVILRRVAKEGGPIPYAWVLQPRQIRVTLDAVSVVDPASELRGIDRDVQAPPASPGRGPLGKSWGRGGGGTNSQGS